MRAVRRLICSILLAGAAVSTVSGTAQSSPPDVPGVVIPPVITSLSLGAEHSCYVREGTVWCSGTNTHGQLGNGTTARTIYFSPSLMTNALSVASGGHRTCAIATDRSVWCWGLLHSVPDPSNAPNFVTKIASLIPTRVPITDALSVVVSPDHICATRTDRTVWCWGANKYGQLGNGTTTASVVPVQSRISRAVAVDVGALHTCAVRATKSVWCWGSNKYGQLGTATPRLRTLPGYVPVVRAESVATGGRFTCIVSPDQRARCWGRNNYGQLSATWGAPRHRPVTSPRKGVVALDAGDEFVCARTVASTTWCWGRNLYGQLGNGSHIAKATAQKVNPHTLVGLLGSVATGGSHACGTSATNSSLWCWGLNSSGQLGDSSVTLRRSGIAVWPNGVHMKPIGSDTSARLIVAGDISCNAARRALYGIGPAGIQCGETSTAALITSLAPDGVIALGDLQYEAASFSDLTSFYAPTWGTFKNITYPVRGNHEYLTSGAAGYVEYFGEMSPSYWTTDAGGWRIIAVDSWCQGQLYSGCAADAAQTQWLARELQRARADGRCAAVMMHHPFVSSGKFATSSVRHLWETSVANGADLVMTAHDHHYERFSPLDAAGAPAVNGTPMIISGLGGAQVYPMDPAVPGSQYMLNSDHGVVQLTLTPTSFSWGFVSAVDNLTYDAGTASCTP